MRTTIARGLAAMLSLATLAACADAPSAPTAPALRAGMDGMGSIRHVDEYTFRLDGWTLQLGCASGGASEMVRLDGDLVERVTYMQLPTGTVMARHDVADRGVAGVGLESGHAYDVERRVHDNDRFADAGILGTHREHWALRDRVTGDAYALTFRAHYAMDADRDIIYDRQWESSRCPM